MPALLQGYFSSPVDRAKLRLTGIQAIQEFDPLAVRRAAPLVIAGLKESPPGELTVVTPFFICWGVKPIVTLAD